MDRDSVEVQYPNNKRDIRAVPNDSYRFVKWDDGNTDNPRNIIVSGNITYTAIFELDKINEILVDKLLTSGVLIDKVEASEILVNKTKNYG